MYEADIQLIAKLSETEQFQKIVVRLTKNQ